MINRHSLVKDVRSALKRSRVVALVGPRQCGKTTLARKLVSFESPNYFDLEDPESIGRLSEPMTALRNLRGTVVIDEVQHHPGLFSVLRVLADRRPLPARFLILGSASPELLRQSSESLAGRIEILTMSGFSLSEVGVKSQERHWQRGGYPLSFTARSEKDSIIWRKNFIRSFLERDLPRFGINFSYTTMIRFWTMLAHYHGQIWNASEPARSLGIGETTVRRYLDILTDVFMIRQLQPWHANMKKRQIKSPKIYFNDSGLLHSLLGIKTEKDLLSHPKSGASWEGYVIEEIIKETQPDEVYFWATHNGAEIDLILMINGVKYGVECKKVDAPKVTPSLRIASSDLKLKRISIVYPGTKHYNLDKNIHVASVTAIKDGFRGLFP